LSPADAAEMVTWETAQALQGMKEQIDRESWELLDLYERIWQLSIYREVREQWEWNLVQEAFAKLDQVEGHVREYRRVQSTFEEELANWRRAHAIIAKVWNVFAEKYSAAEPGKTTEVPNATDWIYWSVGTRNYADKPNNALAVRHIAITEVAGEAWPSKHKNDRQKMAVYEERRPNESLHSCCGRPIARGREKSDR
jgi:hypothetical protein